MNHSSSFSVIFHKNTDFFLSFLKKNIRMYTYTSINPLSLFLIMNIIIIKGLELLLLLMVIK